MRIAHDILGNILTVLNKIYLFINVPLMALLFENGFDD
jgi:hypothetical protein